MYNLVIADDEKNIREGLSRFIDWAELGFNVVMKCEDGDEVIDYINAMSADVVLCDIRMSRKSGLDVAKYIFENSLNIKIVLMSGYQEFEYAKKALEYNVVSYIVKPIELEEIKEKFTKIKNDFDRMKNIKEQMQEEKKKAVEAQNIIFEKYLEDIFKGALKTREDIEENFKLISQKYNFGEELHNYVFSYDLVEGNFEKDKFVSYKASKLTMLKVKVQEGLVLIFYVGSKDEEQSFKREIEEYRCKALDNAGKGIKKKGGIYRDIYELLEKIREEAENNSSVQQDFKALIDQQAHLIEYFLEFDKPSINETFKGISAKIVNMPFSSGLKFLENTLVLLLNRIAASYVGLTIKEELKVEIRNISEALNYSSALQLFEKWINSAVNAIEENNNSNTDLIIKRANKYIEENYMDDLTLEKVAEVVFLSPVYLSKVYKKKMGVNFIDYVTKIRIERSKELLSNKNLKVYEISNLVGYKNLKYFYKLFKNYTGYTPNTYREMLMKQKSINYREDR